MFWGLISLAITAGFLAFFSACGYALLPAYVGFFLAQNSVSRTKQTLLIRGLTLGGAVSVGFVLVPTVLWVLAASIGNAVSRYIPSAALGTGIFLVTVGTIFLVRPKIFSPKLPNFFSQSRAGYIGAMLFGISYAIGGIGCVLPVFLAVIAQASTLHPLAGLPIFAAFALTMSLLMMFLTLLLSLARTNYYQRLRAILPFSYRVGAGLLVIAGTLLIQRELPLV